MTDKAEFALRNRNPDVLTCIANLSNDEVFTPPEFANAMLDRVAEAWADSHQGAVIWQDSTLRFLDPFTKSGVFLREITKRLVVGLEHEIPDLEKRVDHVLTRQVFGIGITRLTSLLARRSVYCSKWANGKHSIARSFTREDGNIWFEPGEHAWVGGTEWVETSDVDGKPVTRSTNGTCSYCGASQKALDRGAELESHAYAFIHTRDIQARIAEIFGEDMQFDVVIGNPPYQLDDGGHGASAVPIYNKFVEQAKALNPRLLSMVIPARWLFGGRGLDGFRRSMLTDNRIRYLVDYPDSRQCFQGVDVAGGISVFVWERDYDGDCTVISHRSNGESRVERRPLLEPGAEVFVRHSEGLSILKKVILAETGGQRIALPEDRRFDKQVSAQKPFGLRTFFRGTDIPGADDDVLVLQSGGRAWVSRDSVATNSHLIDLWKVFTSKSSSEHAGQADGNGMRRVLSLSGLLRPGSVVTETYVLLGAYEDELLARNCLSYVTTKFFRFLVATRTSAQDLSRSAYSFVPLQDFTRKWSDEALYAMYGLTDGEIDYIESTIRPMETVEIGPDV